MNSNTQLDMATMALKGKRYVEAESMYTQIATQIGSSEAWMGLAICKLYQLAEGRTMDEVVFCVEKAKQISPELRLEIENQLIINCQILLSEYLKIFEQSLVKHKELKKQAITGAIIAGVSMAAGSNSKSAFGTITSLAGTGAGIGVAVDAFSKMESLNEIRNFILVKCDEINNTLILSLDKANPAFIQYTSFVNNLVSNVSNTLEAQQDNGKWYMNKSTLLALTIFVFPVGLYGWYLRSKNTR
jgi:hypothetical protein